MALQANLPSLQRFGYKAVSYTHLDVYKRQDYWNTIIALVAKAKVYPVLHGSAMFNIGINELLDAIS